MRTAERAGAFEPLRPGARVEVRRRLDAQWARGFEVAAADPGVYRVRRLSDGVELPVLFAAHDVRADAQRPVAWR